MSNIKEIHSIELTSFTTVLTTILVIFSIIATLILSVAIIAVIPTGGNLVIYLIPTIIVGTFMFGIYNTFSEGLIYNLLSSKLKRIAIKLNGNEVRRISTSETAIMISIITTIEFILLYLVSVFTLPMLLTSVMETLIYTGQQGIAYSLYQIFVMISSPTTIALFIFGTFIITFIFTLLGTYIYNFIASKGRGIILNLSKENNLTLIDSIDTLRLAVVCGITNGVLSLISAIINIISGTNVMTGVTSIFASLIIGFIGGYLLAFIYNLITPKIGKIKLELLDL